MKRLFLLTTIIFNIHHLSAMSTKKCHVELSPIIVVFNQLPKNYNPTFFNRSTCSNDINRSIYQLMIHAKGKIDIKAILNEMTLDNNIDIQFSQQSLTIIKLNDLLKKNMNLKSHHRVHFIDNVPYSFLRFNSLPNIKMTCTNCQNIGEHFVSIDFKTTDQYKKTFRLNTSIEKQIKVYKKKSLLLNTRILDADQFSLVSLYTTMPNKYPSPPFEFDKYQLKTPLDKDGILKFKNLKLPNLVTTGKTVKIKLQKGTLLITTYGMARKSGAKGQIIPVYNQKNNKTILAEVSSENTVKINL